MPELPEVETTKRGIAPRDWPQHHAVDIRQPKLRWPITENVEQHLIGAKLQRIDRRAKYLLLYFDTGYLLVHLGMSGSLCIVDAKAPPTKHAHVDLKFGHGVMLRYTDPRRFGRSFGWGQALKSIL